MTEKIIGSSFTDFRGEIQFNNTLNIGDAKRIYVITNADLTIERGWQAHKIESRWFIAVTGSFEIKVVKVDDFDSPSDDLKCEVTVLKSSSLECLIVKPGFATSIKALEDSSKLIALSDFAIGEVKDEYKFQSNKWK